MPLSNVNRGLHLKLGESVKPDKNQGHSDKHDGEANAEAD